MEHDRDFQEYSSFQVTTGDGKGLSLGFEDIPAGSSHDYMDATKDIFSELAELITPKDSTRREIEQKQGLPL